MSPSGPEGVDGRLSRTVRSRQAICEACLDLVQEGVLQPSADQIATRAGLSRRSIFNHFSDLAELYDAVVEAGTQRCAPLLKKISSDEPIEQRLEQLCDMRSKFLEAMSPFTRSLTAQMLTGPIREEAWRVSQAALRQHQQDVERLFVADLEGLAPDVRRETLESIWAATAPLNWEYLRHSRGLSLARARAVMKRTVVALLREACVSVP